MRAFSDGLGTAGVALLQEATRELVVSYAHPEALPGAL
jgi:hypothetical protein